MIINSNKSHKKVLVMDLDGTLYNINTFHFFIKYLVRFSLKTFNVKLLFILIKAMILRVFKVINHSKMKFIILKAVKGNDKINYKAFVSSLSKYKNQLQIMEGATFDIKVLATAAPNCYSKIIALQEGFDVCLATNTPINNYQQDFENVKEVKKQSVINYLQSLGIEHVDTIVTDHYDDLPLIKIAKQVILVNPSKQTQNILKQNQIFFNIV